MQLVSDVLEIQLQDLNVMKETFVLLEERVRMKGESNFALMDFGELYVMIPGQRKRRL